MNIGSLQEATACRQPAELVTTCHRLLSLVIGRRRRDSSPRIQSQGSFGARSSLPSLSSLSSFCHRRGLGAFGCQGQPAELVINVIVLTSLGFGCFFDRRRDSSPKTYKSKNLGFSIEPRELLGPFGCQEQAAKLVIDVSSPGFGCFWAPGATCQACHQCHRFVVTVSVTCYRFGDSRFCRVSHGFSMSPFCHRDSRRRPRLPEDSQGPCHPATLAIFQAGQPQLVDAHNLRPLGHWRNLEQLRLLDAYSAPRPSTL